MNSAEFIKYITTPLTLEEMQLLYKANNVKYDKCELYWDFIITLNKLVVETFLGDDVINKEEDIKNHFDWCIEKVFCNFKKENIIFDNTQETLYGRTSFEGTLDGLTLGIAVKPVWSRKFKFRIRSTTSGKIIDYNITFKVSKDKTEEDF